MPTVADFANILLIGGQEVTYHRDEGGVPCPCRTDQGSRDPIWHLQNPVAPVCNAAGMLPGGGAISAVVKAFIQPVQSGAVRRLVNEYIQEMFGEVESDDHIGLFPMSWGGTDLNFYDWGPAGEDFVDYRGRKFQVVAANLINDPDGGAPHHWEVGLRLMG